MIKLQGNGRKNMQNKGYNVCVLYYFVYHNLKAFVSLNEIFFMNIYIYKRSVKSYHTFYKLMINEYTHFNHIYIYSQGIKFLL